MAQAVPGAAAHEVMAGEGMGRPMQPDAGDSQTLPPPPMRRPPVDATVAQEAAEKKAAKKAKKSAKKVSWHAEYGTSCALAGGF